MRPSVLYLHEVLDYPCKNHKKLQLSVGFHYLITERLLELKLKQMVVIPLISVPGSLSNEIPIYTVFMRTVVELSRSISTSKKQIISLLAIERAEF